MNNKTKIEYFDGLMNACNIEMRGIFTNEELAILGEIVGKLLLDAKLIRHWPMLILGAIEDTFAAEKYNVDGDKFIKKLKNLTPITSLWLVGRLVNRTKAA